MRDLLDKLSAIEEDEDAGYDQLQKDRAEVTVSMVAPALEKLLSSYEDDAKEWHDRYDALAKGLMQRGLTDRNSIHMEIMDMDDDIVSYVNIDDLEDKIEALQNTLKNPDGDGDEIARMVDYGISDTLPREEFRQDVKYAIKQDHPELYSKIFMYDIGEGTGSKVCDQCEDGKDEDGKECSECGGTGYSDLAEESAEESVSLQEKDDVLFKVKDEDGDVYQIVKYMGRLQAFDDDPDSEMGGGMGPYDYDEKTSTIEHPKDADLKVTKITNQAEQAEPRLGESWLQNYQSILVQR